MPQPLLEMTGLTKSFPGVRALKQVDLELRAGEVHCLVGENGAGKSTLMKILAGGQHADAGEIRLLGEPVHIRSPHHAQELGISMIYQEFNLCPFLSVAENIFLGRQPRFGRSPFIDWPRMRQDAQGVLVRAGVALDVTKRASECSVAEQQMIEIAKALVFEARVLIMDEPSATLTDHELNSLFTLISELKQQGIGIIYISHRLEEIFRIGDRVTIMRDGKCVATRNVGDIDREEIIRMMVGRELKDEFPKQTFERGNERLRLNGLTRKGAFRDVSFALHTGEIVGLTGLVGSGRTEVARAIFGADDFDEGEILLEGAPITVRSPRDAIRQGIGLLTEDRKNHGLILGMSVRENATLANLPGLAGRWLVNRGGERRTVEKFVKELEIKTPSIEQIAANLSGGNQQKLVLAKWLFTDCSILIFDEPTRGIDIGAKVGIYNLMNELVEKGVCILMISSEFPEVLGMCDRILVMHEGRIEGELSGADATQEAIMRLAAGGEQLAGAPHSS